MVTPDEIASRQFLVGLRGFDRDEVTAFLTELADEIRERDERIARLETETREAVRRADMAAQSDKDMLGSLASETRRIIQAAEEAGAAIRLRAEEDAKTVGEQTHRIVQTAEDAAQNIRRRAEEETRKELDEARQRATTIVVEGERRRDAINVEIRQLEEARDRLSEELRDAIEKVGATIGVLREGGGDEGSARGNGDGDGRGSQDGDQT